VSERSCSGVDPIQGSEKALFELRLERKLVVEAIAALERLASGQPRIRPAGDAVLAAIGLYGVMAYIVAQGTREIGPDRERFRPRCYNARHAGYCAAHGYRIAVGLPHGAGAALRHPAQSATLGIAGVALVAGFVPAWRATRVDPMRALRWE
jgi:hypothetical protein